MEVLKLALPESTYHPNLENDANFFLGFAVRCGDGDVVEDGVDDDVGKVLLLIEREAELVVVMVAEDFADLVIGGSGGVGDNGMFHLRMHCYEA